MTDSQKSRSRVTILELVAIYEREKRYVAVTHLKPASSVKSNSFESWNDPLFGKNEELITICDCRPPAINR